MNLHPAGQFPAYRPRRLRQSAALRRMVSETRLSAAQLVLPLFVRSGRKLRRPIDAMPGVFQLSPDELLREATEAFKAGVPTVLLFGIPDRKDTRASGAYAACSRRSFPDCWSSPTSASANTCRMDIAASCRPGGIGRVS